MMHMHKLLRYATDSQFKWLDKTMKKGGQILGYNTSKTAFSQS